MGIVGNFYKQFLGQQECVECWSLKRAIVVFLGILLEM
jgi:hypothetical protein